MAFLEQHLTIQHATQFMRAGDLDQAEAIARELLKKNKRDVDAFQLRGEIAIKRRQYDEALKHFQKCTALMPREGHLYVQLGRTLAMLGRHAEALRKLDKALQLASDSKVAAEWKARVLHWDGDYEGAGAVLQPFIDAGRESHGMAEDYAKVLMHRRQYAAASDLIARHLADDDLTAADRHRMGHVEGSAWERAGDYDRAFACHRSANEAVAIPFDRNVYEQYIDTLIEVFSADFIATRARHGNQSEAPVFIAGMPRSGTTLVEQILDAHPKAFGAGEINDIEQMVANMQIELECAEPFPKCAAELEAPDITTLSKRYLTHVQRMARLAKRIVNKSLENYRHLGLIAVLFPRATIIHCHRDPRDTCVSCYTSGILPGPHPYICDLGDLGWAYRQYERLMAHWREAIPGILDVEYETLVGDLEGQTRRLIEHAGLEWDDACLAFHDSGRVVHTASYEQVRQPIYRSSIGRWKGYEPHLGPLLTALEG